MKIALLLSAFAGATLATAATAGPVDNSVNTRQIASLESAARLSPSDGGAAAELASAYVRVGRSDDAAKAYRRVLKLDNVMLETRTGETVWSHQIARHVLGQNSPQTFTSL